MKAERGFLENNYKYIKVLQFISRLSNIARN